MGLGGGSAINTGANATNDNGAIGGANTGGGGSGGLNSTNSGGSGGSGIIILRYPNKNNYLRCRINSNNCRRWNR